jgi:hypothetical protein
MVSPGTPNAAHEAKRIRARLLELLYARFQAYPYASVEVAFLAEQSHIDAQTLNWNIVYLEKAGYVELDRLTDCPPYVSCSATITAAGIDLVEDEDAWRRRFDLPAQ